MFSAIARAATTLTLILLVSSCGGDGPTPPPPPPPPPAAIASVTVEADAKNLNVGGTLQLRATVKDVQGATRTDVQVSWASLDQTVASVSSAGLVSGSAGGIAQIRATAAAFSDEASLSVARPFVPGMPLELTTDAAGFAHIFTPSFAGLHYKVKVVNPQGGGVPNAIVGYSEQDGKSVIAVDGPDGTWAPNMLMGHPDSLKARLALGAPAGAPSRTSSAAVIVGIASLAVPIAPFAQVALPFTPDAYQVQKLFFHLGADNSSCVSYGEAAALLKTHAGLANHSVAVAFRNTGAQTNTITEASVIRRDGLQGTNAAVAAKLLDIGVQKWGVAASHTTDTRLRVRSDFTEPTKVGAQFRQFWDGFVIAPDDPTCQPAVASLAFATQPSNVARNAVMAPAVRVALRDASGNPVTTANNPVTLTLGQNTTGAVLSGTLTRVPVNGIATFDDLKVDVAGTYTLTATAAGKNATSSSFTVTAPPSSGQGFLGAGISHACAIASSGPTYCWGGAVANVTGDGGAGNSRFVPSLVVGGHTFKMIGGGLGHTCALTTAGAAFCWGGSAGTLGTGTNGTTPTPTAVVGGHTFTYLAVGAQHTCGLLASGAAYCWGVSNFGEAGDGSTGTRLSPVAVTGGLTFASIAPSFLFTCALTPAGKAYCWGNNNAGQLGDGTTANRLTPTAVVGGLTFASLSSFGNLACGLTAAGAAYCWGMNSSGQLGDGTTTNRSSPVAVTGGRTFTSLAVGSDNVCGLVASGAAYCWGKNSGGELGIGATGPIQTAPVAVAGGVTFRALALGALFGCGLSTSGTVYCWGANNFGQLGNATNVNNLAPGPIFGNLVF